MSSSLKQNGLDVIVDLGATHYRIGCGSRDISAPLITRSTPKNRQAIIDALCESVQEVSTYYKQPLSSVSVGCPGLVNGHGYISKVLHLPLSECNLRLELSERLGAEVLVVNDAKSQAVGLSQKDASIFYMVIGTGVGGAVIDRGRLILGAEGFAGEVGHIPLKLSDETCVCGEVGCLDTTVSGWALSRKLGDNWYERPLKVTETELLASAGGDAGVVCALVAVLVNPDTVIVAGPVVENLYFRDGFTRGWARRAWARARLEFIKDTWSSARRGLVYLLSIQRSNNYA